MFETNFNIYFSLLLTCGIVLFDQGSVPLFIDPRHAQTAFCIYDFNKINRTSALPNIGVLT